MSARPRRMARQVIPRGGASAGGPGRAGAGRGAVIRDGAGRASLVSIGIARGGGGGFLLPRGGETGTIARLRRLRTVYWFTARTPTPAPERLTTRRNVDGRP